jgi:Tol biopolymer transport system component
MALSPGDRLGPYEIIEWVGSGGMADVYRARDPRIGRDVAIKALREPASNPAHVAAVTREARAAGSLNHPNILAVYDVATDGDVPYLVEEFLEGETLRMRLDRGMVSLRKAIDYAIQIGQGLASAHAKGIWHRDVKPANIFITRDGHVKLLDFGLAKGVGEHESTVTMSKELDQSYSGRIVGTAGYMSPEQVRGLPIDHRTDIFALGAVLYELFTGMRAFKRPSTVETMNAILNEEPLDPVAVNADLPAGAAAIVRRCLEKDREERFQSARDLVFALQQLRDPSSGSLPQLQRPPQRIKITLAALAVAFILIAAALIALLMRPDTEPSFQPLTFTRGRIGGARFAADGQAVVYSEARQGNALLHVARIDLADSPSSRELEYPPGTDILAARTGELALSLRRRFLIGERFIGTLALAPSGAGLPHEVAENVEDADWDPSGQLAMARSNGAAAGPSWLEYNGRTLHKTSGSIRFVRFSRDGRRLAFVEDDSGRGVSGTVSVVDVTSGAVTVLTDRWASIRGLAWAPGNDEVWFTAGGAASNRSLRAVSLSGTQRLMLEAPGALTLWDVARDGRLLLTRDDERQSIVGQAPGDTAERELSWFDNSAIADLSADGRWLLFGDRFGIYMRSTDGGSASRVANEGFADDLSPDGRTILITSETRRQVSLIPTGPGKPRRLEPHSIELYGGALWFPDNQRILVTGSEPGKAARSYIQDREGSAPKPLTPEGTRALSISPDGLWVAAVGSDNAIALWPVGDGASRVVRGSEPGDRPVAWSADGRSLWLFRRGEVPTNVYKLDLTNGRRELWKTLVPPDPAGVYSIIEFRITPAGDSYFYSYRRLLSQLFLVTGLK